MLSLKRVENLFNPNVWSKSRIKRTCLKVGEQINSALNNGELTDELIKSVFDKNLPKSTAKKLQILDYNQMARFMAKTSDGAVDILEAKKILRDANGCFSVDRTTQESRFFFSKRRQFESNGKRVGNIVHELQHGLRVLHHKKNSQLNKLIKINPKLLNIANKAELVLVELQDDLFCELNLDSGVGIPMFGSAKKALWRYTKTSKDELRELISKSIDMRIKKYNMQGNVDFMRFLKEGAATEKISHKLGNLVCQQCDGSTYKHTTTDLFPAFFKELKKVVNKRLKLQQSVET